MIQVTDETFEADDRLFDVVGRSSDFSGTDGCVRDHGWEVETFAEAQKMRNAIDDSGICSAVIREKTSYPS